MNSWTLRLLLCASLVVLAAVNFSQAQNLNADREGKIKTATLYYLAKFITWPDENLRDNGKLQVCIVGESELNPFVQEILEGKPVGSRLISARLLSVGESKFAVAGCNLMYLGNLGDDQKQQIIKEALKLPVVTVSSTRVGDEFPTVIYLYKERNNVRIEVNLALAKKLKLQVSSELLQVSKVIQ